MSTARGRGANARGSGAFSRGASQSSSTARGGAARGRGQRGGAGARGGFGAPARGDGAKAARGRGAFGKPNGFGAQQEPASLGTGGGTKGRWAERYEVLEQSRQAERAQAIQQGIIADPDKPRSLVDAITPVGTCQDMCAEFERVERVVQNDVWAEESAEGVVFNPMNPQPDESRMVKKFRRAAAGLEEQLPSDLRPPLVLKRTCDYLFDEVVGNAPALEKVHHFVWDRTRAIRNDFSIQQVTKAEDLRMAIECYERIARFHIMSLHLLAGPERPYDKYDAQQEREQLDRTLLSLMQYYDDSRGRLPLPNEAEFRAYCVIFQLQDPIPDLEDRVQSWPRHIATHKRVLAALELYAAACNTADAQGPLRPRTAHLIAQQDFHRFWTLVESPRLSYLMACVAEIYFNMVRRVTLNALHRAFRQSATKTVEDWTVPDLLELLAFDDEDQLETFCKAHGFSFGTTADGTSFLDLLSVKGDLPQTNASCPKQWKSELVEDKRYDRNLPAIINGSTVSQARANGQVTEEEMEMDAAAGEAENAVPADSQDQRKGPFMDEEEDSAADDGDSLFLPESRKTSESKVGIFGTQPPANGTSASGSFTFGKPSNNAFGQPSAAPPLASSAAGNMFGKPSFAAGQAAPATDTALKGSVFGKPTTASDTPGPEAPKKTLFDFAPTPAEPAAAKGLFDFLAKPQEDARPPTASPPPSAQISNGAPLSSFIPNGFNFKPSGAETTGEKPTSQSAASDAATSTQQISPAFSWSFPQPAAPSTIRTEADKPINPIATDPEGSVGAKSAGKLFPFGAPPTAEGATSLNEPVSKPETPSQPQLNFSATAPSKQSQRSSTPPAPSLSPERRVSLVKGTKPKISSPLVNSYLPEEPPPSFAPPGLKPQESAPKATAAEIFTRLASEVFGSEHSGFLEQFIAYTVQDVISSVHDEVVSEHENAKAVKFREEVLLHRYARRWRETLWRKKSAARASQRRERARKGLSALKSSRDSEMGSIIASTRGPSLGRSSGRTEQAPDSRSRQGVGPSQSAEEQAVLGSKRPLPAHGPDSAPNRDTSHKRQKSSSHVDHRGRVSKSATAPNPNADLLRRSAYLGGPSVGASPPARSTTQSSYFRLKALGIGGSDGLSESRGTKRSRDDSLGFKMREGSQALTASKRSTPEFLRSQSSELPPPPPPGPRADNQDEELFARLKRARESLAEGSDFMRASVAHEEQMRRSLSGSVSSSDSPSMTKARIEARWRALQRESPARQLDVPAYRLRESKFVPREDYGKAIERAKELRASRSRATSRPESRLNESVNGSPGDGMQSPDQAPQSGSSALPAASDANGAQFSSIPQWQPPAPQNASGPSAFVKSQQGLSWATANTATLFGIQTQGFQTSQNQNQPSGFGFSGCNPIGGSNGTFAQASNTFTLKPSQVDQSLANSFGQPAMPSQRMISQQHDLESQTFPRDYTQNTSAANSVISDHGEEQTQHPPYANQFAQTGSFAHSAQDTEVDELLDEGGNGEVPDSYQYTNNYSSNPFAALAGEYGEDTEENTEVEQSEDDSAQQEREFYAQRGYQGTQLHNGHYENSSEASLEDEESGDGDVEDVDATEDEGEGEEGYDEEFEDEADYDEEAPRRRPSSGLFRYVNGNVVGGHEEQYDLHGGPFPAKNPELQNVGATEEEAIELSD